MEKYDEIRKRHEQEMKEWCCATLRGGVSVTGAAKRVGMNPGTLWRMAIRLGVLEKKEDGSWGVVQ